MSRLIDPDKPLSDENRQWMMDNGQELRVQEHDARLGVEVPPPAHLTGNEPSLSTGAVAAGLANAPGVSPQMLASALGDKSMLLGSLTVEELEAELERREAAEDGDSEQAQAERSRAATEVVREGEGDVPSYEDWKVPTLKSQLGVRELSKSGTKDDLVDRLREDDQDA